MTPLENPTGRTPRPLIRRVIAAAVFALALLALLTYWTQTARSDGHNHSHAHGQAHGQQEPGTFVSDSGQKTWMTYTFDPKDPEALADFSEHIFFGEVLSVGETYQVAQPEGDTFDEPQVVVQDLEVELTEDPIIGQPQNGDTVTVQRAVLPDGSIPNPAAGERWMFFTNSEFYEGSTDTYSGKYVVNAQPYGEKKVADDAERDQLFQTYNGPANNVTTAENPPPFLPNGEEPGIQEYCTPDAPDGCEQGRMPPTE